MDGKNARDTLSSPWARVFIVGVSVAVALALFLVMRSSAATQESSVVGTAGDVAQAPELCDAPDPESCKLPEAELERQRFEREQREKDTTEYEYDGSITVEEYYEQTGEYPDTFSATPVAGGFEDEFQHPADEDQERLRPPGYQEVGTVSPWIGCEQRILPQLLTTLEEWARPSTESCDLWLHLSADDNGIDEGGLITFAAEFGPGYLFQDLEAAVRGGTPVVLFAESADAEGLSVILDLASSSDQFEHEGGLVISVNGADPQLGFESFWTE